MGQLPNSRTVVQFSQIVCEVDITQSKAAQALCSGGGRLHSRPQRLSWPISFLVILSSYRQKPRSFLFKSFSQYFIHRPSYCSTLCAPATDRAVMSQALKFEDFQEMGLNLQIFSEERQKGRVRESSKDDRRRGRKKPHTTPIASSPTYVALFLNRSNVERVSYNSQTVITRLEISSPYWDIHAFHVCSLCFGIFNAPTYCQYLR
jgi:hypothetical protein